MLLFNSSGVFLFVLRLIYSDKLFSTMNFVHRTAKLQIIYSFVSTFFIRACFFSPSEKRHEHALSINAREFYIYFFNVCRLKNLGL